MAVRVRGRRVAFALVAVLGVGLIGWLGYVLSPDVRLAAVAALDRAGADDRLAALTDDPDKDVRAAAADALVRRGAAAVPALVGRLGRPDPDARAFAANALARLGSAGRDAAPALTRLVREDPDGSVRAAAAYALDAVAGDDPATAAEFVRLLAEGGEPDRVLSAGLVAGHADRFAGAVPALGRALRDPSPEVRTAAAEALEGLGPRAGPAVPALAGAVRDPVPGVRKEAAEALERFLAGGAGDPALRDLARRALAATAGDKDE